MSAIPDTNSAPATTQGLKRILGFLLIAAAVAAVAIGILRQGRSSESEPHAAASILASEQAATDAAVTVFYFHGDTRCPTCRDIETRTEQLVRKRFAAELDAGALQYVAINYDVDANRHYREDFELTFGSVVVRVDGTTTTWENLADVWSLIHEDDESRFDAYLAEHIAKMLERAG